MPWRAEETFLSDDDIPVFLDLLDSPCLFTLLLHTECTADPKRFWKKGLGIMGTDISNGRLHRLAYSGL